MTKFIIRYALTIALSAFSLSFVACSDDKNKSDEPEIPVEKNGLIGNWYDGYDIITFKTDGTYTYYEYAKLDQKTYEDIWDGLYDYDKKTGLVTIYYGADVDCYMQITSIVNNTLIAKIHYIDEDDEYIESTTFRRISDEDMPIYMINY